MERLVQRFSRVLLCGIIWKAINIDAFGEYLSTSILMLSYVIEFKIWAEHTVQQKEGLQPPPLNPGYDSPEDDDSESTEVEQLKGENFFLTSFEPHLGQTVSLSVIPTL